MQFNLSYVICMSFVCQSYVPVCHWYVICMSLVCTRTSFVCHSYVIRMSVCTRLSSTCHSYVRLCHPYVTRISFVCHSYVDLPWWYSNINFIKYACSLFIVCKFCFFLTKKSISVKEDYKASWQYFQEVKLKLQLLSFGSVMNDQGGIN